MKNRKRYIVGSLLIAVMLVGCAEKEEKEVAEKPIPTVQEVVIDNTGKTETDNGNYTDVLIFYPVDYFGTEDYNEIKNILAKKYKGFQVLKVEKSKDGAKMQVSFRGSDYEKLQAEIKKKLDESAKLMIEEGTIKTFDPSNYLTEYLIVVDELGAISEEDVREEYKDILNYGYDLQHILNIVPEDIHIRIKIKDLKGNTVDYLMSKYPNLERSE